ncbi:MAG: hypothetical protein E7293_10035 [Lachnospiraceae bacterium]|nr:hypothetical protein [Lachnospiraceae bacterium]
MIPLIISYILNIVDYIFTLYWVKLYGIEMEGNPFGRWMLEHHLAWVFKILVVGVLFVLLGYMIKRYRKGMKAAYLILTVYSAVVVYHISICFALMINET